MALLSLDGGVFICLSTRGHEWFTRRSPKFAASKQLCRCSVGAARSRGLLLQGLVLRDNPFEPRNILQQSLAGQDQEKIAELRVLKVDLEQLVVSDGQHMTILDAFDRCRAPVIGREEAKLAHQISRRKLD